MCVCVCVKSNQKLVWLYYLKWVMYELLLLLFYTIYYRKKLIWINTVYLEAEFIRGSVRELRRPCEC